MKRAMVLFFTLATTRLALADVVAPPPDDCPGGTRPMTGHCGPQCAADLCEDDSTCAKGQTCRAITACVRHMHCGRALDGSPPSLPISLIEGACPKQGSCLQGTCETIRVCSGGSSGGSCSLGSGDLSAMGGLVGVSGLLFLWHRRRRRAV